MHNVSAVKGIIKLRQLSCIVDTLAAPEHGTAVIIAKLFHWQATRFMPRNCISGSSFTALQTLVEVGRCGCGRLRFRFHLTEPPDSRRKEPGCRELRVAPRIWLRGDGASCS